MKIPNRFFQWIEGENFGVVEKLVSITDLDGEKFYNFESGECCNMRYISPMTSDVRKLHEKVMVEVANPATLWTREKIESRIYIDDDTKQESEIPPLEDIVQGGVGEQSSTINSKLGQFRLKAPVGQKILYKNLPSPDMFPDPDTQQSESQAPAPEAVTTQPQQPAPEVSTPMPAETQAIEVQPVETQTTVPQTSSSQASVTDDPIEILLSKCKVHTTTMDVEVTLDLPSKSMYNLVRDEFDEGEEKFIDCVMRHIDVDAVLGCFKTALLKAYNSETCTD